MRSIESEYDFDWRMSRIHCFSKRVLVFIIGYCSAKHQAASASSPNSCLNVAKAGIGIKDLSDLFCVDSCRMQIAILLKRWCVTEHEEANHGDDRD